MEKEIKIAIKMQLCLTTAKQLHGKDYPERIEGYIEMIQRYQDIKGGSIMEAIIAMCEFPSIKEEAYAIIMVMAAGCEMFDRKGGEE